MSLCFLGKGEVVPILKTPGSSFNPPKMLASFQKVDVLTKQAFDVFIFFQFRCFLSKLMLRLKNLFLYTNGYKLRNIINRLLEKGGRRCVLSLTNLCP